MQNNLSSNLEKFKRYKRIGSAEPVQAKENISPVNKVLKSPPTILSKPIKKLETSPVRSHLLETSYKSSALSSFSYPWTRQIHDINSSIFKNPSFRAKQEDVINAVFQGQDIFVCMPTGGGKSLTFQLPAVLSQGITLVVMPLVSLIFDQITLLTKLGIQVRALNSSLSFTEQNKVYDDILYDPTVKLLFLTPEKLSQSDKLNNYLMKLYIKGKLERIAVDEAHCVSQWGRDFRADYMKLSKFRENFPKVPIIALTATATEQVRADVCKLLGMKNPAFFLSSFNRPNLTYEVRQKGKKSIEEIGYFIKQKKNESGLVYCISKKDCESLAQTLQEGFAIKTGFYHANLSTERRNAIQTQWMKGEVQVLVATIAFGMGIDKRDCRFVIHYSLPKSLEGYYQESGRAGRDGKQAECILYFSYADKIKQEFLITKSLGPGPQQEKSIKELNVVICYCEDTFTCRRKLQLEYFGESFNSKDCNKTCDNCCSGKNGYEKDVTSSAMQVISILKGPRNGLNTLLQVSSLLKGANLKKNEGVKAHESFGALKECSREDIEKMLRKMLSLEIIKEKPVKNFKNVINNVIELGPNHQKLLEGELKVAITCEVKRAVIIVSDNQNGLMKNLDQLKFRETEKKENFQLNCEQKEELTERIQLVIRAIARKTKKRNEEILSKKALNELVETLPDVYPGAPKEVLDEIKHFKEICLKESEDRYKFDIDLEEINLNELDFDLKRKISPMKLPCKSLKIL